MLSNQANLFKSKKWSLCTSFQVVFSVLEGSSGPGVFLSRSWGLFTLPCSIWTRSIPGGSLTDSDSKLLITEY